MAKKNKVSVDNVPGKLYVICEAGFEYNDEIYHRPESGGGRPVSAFATSASAEKACHERNFKEFLGNWNELTSFFYDMDEAFTGKAMELLEKHGIDAKRGFEDKHWQGIPPEDVREIYNECSIRWYEVYEVDNATSGDGADVES